MKPNQSFSKVAVNGSDMGLEVLRYSVAILASVAKIQRICILSCLRKRVKRRRNATNRHVFRIMIVSDGHYTARTVSPEPFTGA